MRRYFRIIVTSALLAMPFTGHAEDYRLPDAAELATYSPAATQFYQNGIKALDKVDYLNAYANLAKAAQLQPMGMRLNMIVAGLAIKNGRSRSAAEAKPYYETAITSYKNVLRQPGLPEDFLRDVENRLKVTTDERDNLAQRDARREAVGSQFVMRLNRDRVEPTPRATPKVPTPVGTAAAGAVPVYPGMMAATPAVAGAPMPSYPGAAPTPGYGSPGLPSLPGMPAAPGAPGAPSVPGAPPAGDDPGAHANDPMI